ncbi:MAG: hypothetical protein MZU91_00580 [Desulfosudis oleivorans]|nr:hypothetical protein [Desulfosudis oleivorans]
MDRFKSWQGRVEVGAGQPVALPEVRLEPADGRLAIRSRPARGECSRRWPLCRPDAGRGRGRPRQRTRDSADQIRIRTCEPEGGRRRRRGQGAGAAADRPGGGGPFQGRAGGCRALRQRRRPRQSAGRAQAAGRRTRHRNPKGGP